MLLNLTPALFLITTILAAPIDLETRQASTRNDLLNGPCRPVTVIYARGTTESGNIGTVVGPPLDSALDSLLGAIDVAFQGVNYPASFEGFAVGGSPEGSATLASLVSQAANKCPNTQIVLGGYSQGAQVVYKGAAQLSTALAARVCAAVLFGNPNNGQPVPKINNANVKTFCNVGDLICQGQPIVLGPHLTYGADAPAAAAFIASRITL